MMTSGTKARATLVVLMLGAVLPGLLGASATAQTSDGCGKACRDDLARARAATEGYWRVSAALADGFVESGGCLVTPQGAVGIEYVNPARAIDETVDVERPTSLLYMPEGVGFGRRLVAVEYSVPDRGQEPPEMFGRPFGSSDGRYRLRAWLFSQNPDGMFAAANPAEACDPQGPVAPHGVLNQCREVNTSFDVPAERVREVWSIPPEFRLQGEDEEGGGTAPMILGGFTCDRVVLEDGTEVGDLRFAELWVNVQAPDWEGADDFASRYLLGLTFNNRAAARSFRRGMGVGSEAIRFSPEVVSEFLPIVGRTGEYSFSSPDFALRAPVGDPATDGRVFLRAWREGKHGMGYVHAWVGGLTFAPTVVEVTLTPGTPLAELVGCDPDASTCDPVTKDGLAVTFDAAPYTTTALQQMWNPRHDLDAEVDDDPACDDQCRARAATERYWLVDAATADGFVEATGCGSSGAGTLGIQYVNPVRAWDQAVDVERPESLIYMPEGFMRAGRRLVGVEYSVPVLEDGLPYLGDEPPADRARLQDPPELFGRAFHGPAPARAPGLPWQYYLRAWLFSANPDGLFADANPTEACRGADHVAPHALEDTPQGALPEVFGIFFIEADRVREELGIPEELGLRPAMDGNPDHAQVIVGTRQRRWSSGDGPMTLTTLALPLVALRAPNWEGDPVSPFVDLYPFEWVTDHPGLADWMREGMGVNSEVIRHAEGFAGTYDPLVDLDPNYRVQTPDYLLSATFPEAAPWEGSSTNIRIWHPSTRGMGLLTAWHDAFRFHNLVDVEVTPRPGTRLAALLGCEPQAEACETKRADAGVLVDFRAPSPWTARVSHDWWNPRHSRG